ncbi:MAG: hypothetical protein IPM75_12370 [Candidatus Competibacteraceae bacterium]|nr:hypothetical protein [Candidatus Competibacteraceae bacterium]
MKLLRRDSRPDYAFDPRARPWYQAARRQSGRIRTDPYLFFTTREAASPSPAAPRWAKRSWGPI